MSITEVFQIIGNFLKMIIDTLYLGIDYIKSFTEFIFEFIKYLPTEITGMLTIVITVGISVMIYKFIR